MQTLDFAEMLEQYLDDPYQYQLMSQGFSSVINLIQFVMRILMIIGMWLMFEKAGEHGWGSFLFTGDIFSLRQPASRTGSGEVLLQALFTQYALLFPWFISLHISSQVYSEGHMILR